MTNYMQNGAASKLRQDLATYGVTTSVVEDWTHVLVNGRLAVEFVYPLDGHPPRFKRHWPGARPHIRTNYGGNHFRSANELRVAALLDMHKIKWRYEHKTFQVTASTSYLPDFVVEPHKSIAPFLEIKDAKKVRQLAESLGMTAWDKELPDEAYELHRAPVIAEKLEPDLRKPFWLSAHVVEDVWVLPGKTSNRQPYVVFHPDGTASASRQCPLFQAQQLTDTANHIARSFTEWPSPGAPIYTPWMIAEVITTFLQTEGWITA